MTGPEPGPGYDRAEAVRHLVAADPALAALVDRAGPCTLAPDPEATLFDRLASSVLSQQLSVKAAATIAGRLRAAASPQAPDEPGLTTTAFEPARLRLDPARVAALDDETMRAAGVSRPKVAALRDLADAVLTGRVPTLDGLRGMPDDEVVATLTAVRGIGPWTVHMLLLFQLDRPDVFPVTDVGVRRGFELCLGLDHRATPAEMLERSAAWSPYRSVAAWYLWRALELPMR